MKSWFAPHEKIYILPTTHGLFFLGGIVVMILTAATYNNNLIYLLSFTLFGILVVSMVQTHTNLKALEVKLIRVEERAAGDPISLELKISNNSSNHRRGLRVKVAKAKARLQSDPYVHLGEVQRFEGQLFRLSLAGLKRGVHPIPKLVLDCVYPLGLFRAWRVFKPEGAMYVYPKPQGSLTLPEGGVVEGRQNSVSSSGVDKESDFKEHRLYRSGESYRHVDWKAYARRKILFTKMFEGKSEKEFVFDFKNLRGEEELKLSQLSKWIILAERQGAVFELRLPQFHSGAGAGIRHSVNCLKALAEFHEGISS